MLRCFVLCPTLPGFSPAPPTDNSHRRARRRRPSLINTNLPFSRAGGVCNLFLPFPWSKLASIEGTLAADAPCLPAPLPSPPPSRSPLPDVACRPCLPLQHFNQIKVAPSQMLNLPCPCRQFAGHHLHPWLQGKTAPHSVKPDRIGLESVAPGCNLYLYHNIT